VAGDVGVIKHSFIEMAADKHSEDSEIPILRGAVVRKKINRIKSVFVDISFPDITTLPDVIVFQNYYSSSMTIAQQVAVDEFVTILDHYQLMNDAHSESEAQNWHEIDCKLFNGNYKPGATMRFTLYQPDPSWLKYEIQNIKAVSRFQSSGKAKTSSAAFDGRCLPAMITADWTRLLQAEQTQKKMQKPPPITFSLAEYRKMQKKKEKKKDKKGGGGSLAVTNDEFGISIPDFSKNEDAL
jgi:hypothetical protein